MPVKSTGFAIGNLRARENTLLKNSDLSQLLAAKSTDELENMLRDKGIGYQTVRCDVSQMLKDDTEKLWKYLTEIAPDMAAFEPFIYENDFHNYKAILKSVVRSRNFEDLLIVPASIEIPVLERAVKEKRFDLLPDFLRDAAEKSYEVITQTGDSQLCDGIIDAACMTAQLEKAKHSKNDIVIKVITAMVFFNNIKSALRASKAGKSAAFLDDTLTETGVISKKELKNAALTGEDKVLELLATATMYGGAEAAESYKNSPGDFEKFCDNRIIQIAKACKYITMGIEPLIGYMLARKTEIKDIRIIYSGIKTGQTPEKTKERLRELYG